MELTGLRNVVISLHVVAVISWMAGVLYLYRLLVYHAEETEAVVRERLVGWQRKLWRFITLPAMLATIGFGALTIALNAPYYLRAHWLHAKLLFVVGLVVATLYAGRAHARLAAGHPAAQSGRHYRGMNEVPTLLMIVIVLLVICKPF